MTRPVFLEQRPEFCRQEFLETGIDDISPLQQFDRIAPLDLPEIGLVHEIPKQALQSFRQRPRKFKGHGEILVFGLAEPALAITQHDTRAWLRGPVGAAAMKKLPDRIGPFDNP